MADIKFRATWDNTEVVTGFEDVERSTKETTKVVQAEAKKQGKAFNDEYGKVKPIPQPVSAPTMNAVRALKAEVKQLAAEALAAGEGTALWAKKLEEAGKKKGEINDLQAAIASLDPDVKARAFTSLAQSGAESLQGISGTMALLGVKSEDYEKVLIRLQGLQGLSAGIAGITDLKDKWTEAKLALGTYLSKMEAKIVAEKIANATVIEGSVEQIAASQAAVVAIEEQAAATAEATIAQRIWNLVQASSPWGMAAVAIGVLVTVIATYVSSTRSAQRAEEDRNTAMDGTILKSKELKDSYNEHLVALREMNNAYKVFVGSMTSAEAEMDNLKEKNKQALSDIAQETKAKMEEASGFWSGAWTAMSGMYKGHFNFVKSLETEKSKIQQEAADKTVAIKQKEADDLKAIQEKEIQDEFDANVTMAKQTRLMLDETIKDDHARKIKQLKDNAEFAIQDINESKANQYVKAEAIAAINKKLNFDIDAENEAHNKAEADALKKHNDELAAIQRKREQAELDARAKHEQDLLDLKKRYLALVDSTVNLSETDKENIRYQNQLDELERIAQEARDKGVFNQSEYTDAQQRIESQHAQKMTDILVDMWTANADATKDGSEKDRKALAGELKQTFDLVKKAADDIIKAQQDAIDTQKNLNDQKLAENDRYLSVLTDQLKTEASEKAKGHANNFAQVEQELADEKNARLKNLADQKLIQAEQSKLNRIKLIEDKSQQASALITAAANILKGWSTLPILGQALGVASIGAMLVSFLAFSKKASAAPGFAKGTKNAPPGLKWVGEEGPELINDKGGYRIFTNKESKQLAEGFSGKYPKFAFDDLLPAMQNGKLADTKGIERRIDYSNELLEKGINKRQVTYQGNRKIESVNGTTIITTQLNG